MTDWLTIKQAMELTGLADKTIRRYVKKGKLPHQRTARGHILVDISGLDLPDQTDRSARAQPAQPSSQQELIELRAEVDKLKGLNEQLMAERNNLWRSLETTQRLMAALTSQTRLIEASTTEQPSQAKWWQFWK